MYSLSGTQRGSDHKPWTLRNEGTGTLANYPY